MWIKKRFLLRHVLLKGSFCVASCFLLITVVVINSVNAWDQMTASNHGKIVITDEDIKKMNVHSMVDLLNQIPGVSATDTSVSFRGSSVKNILVLLDGRAINNPASSYRAVNWGMVSINTIEKIEIYKGTGSVLYGDDTSGGVVSITTKKISRGSRGNIEVSYGRFDSQKYDLIYQNDLGNFGLGLSGGWEKEDGFRINSDEDKKRFGTKLNYKSDLKKNIVFSVDYSQFEKGSPGPTYSPSPRARSREKDWGSTFVLPLGRVKSTTHYSGFDKRYNNPDTGLDNIMESRVLNERLSSPISAGRLGQLNIGTDLEIADVEGNKIISQQEEKYAFYFTKEVSLQKTSLNLGLGVRANFYSDFPTAINPQVQLSYKYDDLDLHLSANRSNNIPTFYQRYYETSTLKPNPDLGMEKAMNYNLSLSYRPKETLEGSVSFFLNDITERITYVREDSIGRYKNIGSATLKGIEIAAKCVPCDLLTAKTSYTYLIAKDEDTGKWLPNNPKHRWHFELQLRSVKDFSLGLSTIYQSKRFSDAENNKAIRGTYFRSDLRGDYSLKENIKLFFKITNLFNRDYDTIDGYPATPRAGMMGMGYEF